MFCDSVETDRPPFPLPHRRGQAAQTPGIYGAGAVRMLRGTSAHGERRGGHAGAPAERAQALRAQSAK